MKQLKNTLLLVLVFLTLGAQAQINPYGRKEMKRDKQVDQLNAEKQIRNLRDGALLFRLRTRLPLINALLERGRPEQAEMVHQNQLEKNRQIIAAFKAYFDFCPVYFFNSNYSDYIREDKMDSLLFVNDSALVDHTIYFPDANFLIAEIAALSPDTSSYVAGTYLYRGENGLEQREYREQSGNFGFEALVFKSAAFYQLRRPFPYYSRTLQSLPIFRRSYKRVIQRANEALHYYYNKVY